MEIISFKIKPYKIIAEIRDIIEHLYEIEEQLHADLYLSGINTEIKEQIIKELADKITTIGQGIIIMAYHE